MHASVLSWGSQVFGTLGHSGLCLRAYGTDTLSLLLELLILLGSEGGGALPAGRGR